MKSTELFVEQTLTGFLVLAAAAAPFVSTSNRSQHDEWVDARGPARRQVLAKRDNNG